MKATEKMFSYIGHKSSIKDNLPAKTVVHALVGGVASKLRGGDFSAGAIATATGHVVGEYVRNNLMKKALNGEISIEELKRQTKAISQIVSGAVTIQAKGDVSDKDLAIAQEMSESVVEKNVLGMIAITAVALSAWLNAPDMKDELKSGATPLADLTPVTSSLSAMTNMINSGSISAELAISELSRKLKVPKAIAKRYYDKIKYAIGSKKEVELVLTNGQRVKISNAYEVGKARFTKVSGKSKESKLKVGKVDTYKNLKKKTGDGTIDRDHIPSKAALIKRAEELKGKKLTPAEKKRIINESQAITVKKEVHKNGSTTGAKNKTLSTEDAKDLENAAKRDVNERINSTKKFDSENLQKVREGCAKIGCYTNKDYDEFLRKILRGE